MLALLTQKLKSRNLSQLSILTVALTALLLTGCISIQSNLALYGSGEWSGVQAITLSPDFVELMESEGNQAEGDLSATTEEIDQWIQQAQSATDGENLNVEFNEVEGDDGSLSYVLQADGAGYEALNQILFQGEADISVAEVDGQRQITIRYDTSQATEGENTPADEEMSAEMMELFGFSFATRISGGQIISHNADRLEGNTAIWETPGLVEITLTEAAEFDPETVALQAAPTGSGSSLTTLLETLEEEGVATSAETSDQITTEETVPAEAESSTESTSVTGSESEALDTTDEAIASDDTPAAAPTEEEQALPQSGAILPQGSSAASFILAGLVLLGLVGSGTIALVSNRK